LLKRNGTLVEFPNSEIPIIGNDLKRDEYMRRTSVFRGAASQEKE